MMADRYNANRATDGGLLYYLKTGHLMGVPLPHNEVRALLIRRNFLAKYFREHPEAPKPKSEDEKQTDVSPSPSPAPPQMQQNLHAMLSSLQQRSDDPSPPDSTTPSKDP